MRACCTRVFSSSIQKFDCVANKDVFSHTDTDVHTYIIKLSNCLCPVHVNSHTIPATHVAPLSCPPADDVTRHVPVAVCAHAYICILIYIYMYIFSASSALDDAPSSNSQ